MKKAGELFLWVETARRGNWFPRPLPPAFRGCVTCPATSCFNSAQSKPKRPTNCVFFSSDHSQPNSDKTDPLLSWDFSLNLQNWTGHLATGRKLICHRALVVLLNWYSDKGFGAHTHTSSSLSLSLQVLSGQNMCYTLSIVTGFCT